MEKTDRPLTGVMYSSRGLSASALAEAPAGDMERLASRNQRLP
jgi:hypothetical protein